MGRTYAISDVHGMGHLLDQMLEKIAFSEADRLYVLGDLIDRGPDPAGVLDLAMERKNIIALKGNHEDAFVDWYDTVPDKIHNRYYYNTYDFLMDSRRTRERLPEYVEFMASFQLFHRTVHAHPDRIPLPGPVSWRAVARQIRILSFRFP